MFHYCLKNLRALILPCVVLCFGLVNLIGCAIVTTQPNQQAMTHLDLGITYTMEGKWDEAIQQLQELKEREPQYPNVEQRLQEAQRKKRIST